MGQNYDCLSSAEQAGAQFDPDAVLLRQSRGDQQTGLAGLQLGPHVHRVRHAEQLVHRGQPLRRHGQAPILHLD
ncbi:hypothetical protein ACIP9H_07895 [Streptomyces sp. NPDC088732]|uniref:hypothetical protein n=1 Tax=Streptomyces sp. NPDC088732 TaxID=3365879 RepID=UPI0038117AE6